ncbi:hypothetical protein SEEM1958_003980 [Salmonella enterica subsp. enterica serovar Mbandaka str. ATCC 51958]|nr:hypothetical protein SEEM1958_003980 [Salmonella enterica subsp. enterica serovar Mbandaka str. ATCC 51958]
MRSRQGPSKSQKDAQACYSGLRTGRSYESEQFWRKKCQEFKNGAARGTLCGIIALALEAFASRDGMNNIDVRQKDKSPEGNFSINHEALSVCLVNIRIASYLLQSKE